MRRKLLLGFLAVVSAGVVAGSSLAHEIPPPPEDVNCNSGRGNGPEVNLDSLTYIVPSTGSAGTAPTDDCDPGMSGAVNAGGD
jgi:hypothetical protein